MNSSDTESGAALERPTFPIKILPFLSPRTLPRCDSGLPRVAIITWCCCRWWRGRARRRCGTMPLLSWRCHWSSMMRTGGRTSWQAWNHDRNEVLRIAHYPNPVINEMWFLTIDPFIGISVFIAKLSKRQYCWRVLEDFHRQEYIQLFDINRCLFMRLHFSIGGYDYRRTARFRQSVHFSII